MFPPPETKIYIFFIINTDIQGLKAGDPSSGYSLTE